jgi:hypothetical protein
MRKLLFTGEGTFGGMFDMEIGGGDATLFLALGFATLNGSFPAFCCNAKACCDCSS